MLQYDANGRIIVPNVSLEQAAAAANAAGYNGDALLQRRTDYNGIGDATIDLNGYDGTEESIAGNKGVQSDQSAQSIQNAGGSNSGNGYSQYTQKTTVSGTTQPAGSYVSNQNAQAQVKAGMNTNPDYSLNYLPTEAGKAYDAAMQKIAADLGDRPVYSGKWDPEVEASYNAIVNRDPFSYVAEEDPYWQQYQQRYTDLGQRAMKDTMGQAAALTGGYGNTYAQYAGQSAYNEYMAALADKALELEDRAYGRWIDQGNQMLQNFQLAQSMQNTDYGRYRDAVSDYNYNLALAQAYEDENYQRAVYDNSLRIQAEQEAYARLRDQLGDLRYEDELGYARWRDQISDYRYEDETAYARQRDAIMDARYEDELAYARAQDAAAAAEKAAGGGSSGGGSRSSGGGGTISGSSAPAWWNSMSTSERKNLQRQIGTDADGIWGPNTAAAYISMFGNNASDAPYVAGINGYDSTPIYSNAQNEAGYYYLYGDDTTPGILSQYVKIK